MVTTFYQIFQICSTFFVGLTPIFIIQPLFFLPKGIERFAAFYGRATAQRFVEMGCTVIITGRREDVLQKTASEIGAIPFCADATSYDDWTALADFVKTQFGHLDLLINNAGGGVAIRETDSQKPDDIDYAIRLNLNSVIYGCSVFAPLLKQQKHGTIINISSVCPSKHGPDGLYKQK